MPRAAAVRRADVQATLAAAAPAEADQQVFRIDVFRPAAFDPGRKLPFISWAIGSLFGLTDFQKLLELWASHGFVVFTLEANAGTDSPEARGDQLLAALDYLVNSSTVRSRVDRDRPVAEGIGVQGVDASSSRLERDRRALPVGSKDPCRIDEDPDPGDFSSRYVFPDGAPQPLSRVLLAFERAGLETHHIEDFRDDYAETLRHWARRLDENLDEAVRLAGHERVRVWRLYLRAARNGFETGFTSIYQVRAS